MPLRQWWWSRRCMKLVRMTSFLEAYLLFLDSCSLYYHSFWGDTSFLWRRGHLCRFLPPNAPFSRNINTKSIEHIEYLLCRNFHLFFIQEQNIFQGRSFTFLESFIYEVDHGYSMIFTDSANLLTSNFAPQAWPIDFDSIRIHIRLFSIELEQTVSHL